MVHIEMIKINECAEELVKLFECSFGISMTVDYLKWKYLLNPFAISDECIVAIESGNIVGARPILFYEMWIDEEKIRTAQPCDTMVHPKYRRRGIFSNMNVFAVNWLKENNIVFCYNFPGKMSRNGYLKQGWKPLFKVEDLFLILNPKKVIFKKVKNRILTTSLNLVNEMLLKKPVIIDNSAFETKVFDKFNSELVYVDNLRDISKIELVRNESFFRWRFDQNPKNKYRFIIAKKYDKTTGYAAITSNDTEDLKYGIISDYVVKDNDDKCFYSIVINCIEELKNMGCDLIMTWTFCNKIYRDILLKNFNFKSSLAFPYNLMTKSSIMVLKIINKDIINEVNIFNKCNWNITHIYSDTG